MRWIFLVLTLFAGNVRAQDRVLVYSQTTGFRHASIGDGITMLRGIAAGTGIRLDFSENGADFTTANLAQYRAVVWLSTTGNLLDATQRQAYQSWMEAGGGFVGIHAASDCSYDWAWYGSNVLGNGAWFRAHPAIQTATVIREDANDLSTRDLPSSFSFLEEWYNFRENPRPAAQVLLRLDETSYMPGTGAMGEDHPISWKRIVGAGRSWYTGLGHRSQTYTDARFVAHVRGGLLWAAGLEDLVLRIGFEAP